MKQIAIAESYLTTADIIIKAAKELPKKNKYFFSKDYSRGKSRRDKRARRTASLKMVLAAQMGAAQIAMIVSQPIPKFQKGAL